MIGIDPAKQARLAATLEPYFEPADGYPVRYDVELTRDQVRAAVAMGPNAWHVPADVLADRVAHLPELNRVRVDAEVRTYRRRRALST